MSTNPEPNSPPSPAPSPAPNPAPPPILSVRDLRVRIGQSSILQGVGFDVAPTGTTALLGRNGVGKTTTVRAVLGLLPEEGEVTGGTVRLDGEDVTGHRTHTVVRRGVGYVPEDRGVFGSLTVAENLTLAERAGGPHHYDLVHDLFPELKARRAQRAGTLSGGQQQMVALARALLNDNRLVIVDEPTKGLAPRVVTEVAEVLQRAAERVPVLLVEQNLAVVRRLARDAVVLDAGRTVHTGDAAALLADRERTTSLLGVGRHERPERSGQQAGERPGEREQREHATKETT